MILRKSFDGNEYLTFPLIIVMQVRCYSVQIFIFLCLKKLLSMIQWNDIFELHFVGKLSQNITIFYTLQFESICGPGILYFIDIRLLYLKLASLCQNILQKL